MPRKPVPNALELRAVRCMRKGIRMGPADASVPAGGLTVLRGGDSSGKEILFRILGLLERAEQGEVFFQGNCLQELDESALAELRRRHFGYLYAAPFLLPAFTVIENVVMPMFKILDSDPSDARLRAEELLEFAGVAEYEQERAGELPNYEQRCVALARALATEPSVLLVEDLDTELQSEQRHHFSRLLRGACQRWGTTIIGTASPVWIAAAGDHVYEVVGGKMEIAPAPLPQS
ncbi:MAG: ATP-binding cassette domain-containing protein [Verrucomicrobiaceae bacterium]|nr:MAG: ATP-binding cassette domain-containing protein [Verrucomicrobiaceae bacterium]